MAHMKGVEEHVKRSSYRACKRLGDLTCSDSHYVSYRLLMYRLRAHDFNHHLPKIDSSCPYLGSHMKL